MNDSRNTRKRVYFSRGKWGSDFFTTQPILTRSLVKTFRDKFICRNVSLVSMAEVHIHKCYASTHEVAECCWVKCAPRASREIRKTIFCSTFFSVNRNYWSAEHVCTSLRLPRGIGRVRFIFSFYLRNIS